MARSIRDHLADCTSTLPMLLREQRHASLHFYFGNFNAMRKEIFPSLYAAYQHWQQHDDLEPLHEQVQRGQQHWRELSVGILDLHRRHNKESLNHIVKLVESNRL